MSDELTPEAAELWAAFLRSPAGASVPETASPTAWHFCDNEADADELAALVHAGTKAATCSCLWVYEFEGSAVPEEGEFSIITDWAARPVCVIRTTSVRTVPFDEVTAEFAAAEGEGDRSLAHWRRVHWDFFSRELSPWGREATPSMPLVCERFEVVFR